MTPRVLFYVQHLLGIGHLKRAATLARAMAGEGLHVTVVSGGDEVPVLDRSGLTLVQLPSIRASDRTFSALVSANGEEIDGPLQDERRNALLSLLDEVAPHVVMTELYPFGRRALRFELAPLIEAARARNPRPLIISSVRDILVEKGRPERDAEMVAAARSLFDAILVHGDPEFIPFERTFPLAGEIEDLLHYTGYVVEHAAVEAATGDAGAGEVIVSSGSGAVGEQLLRAAISARSRTRLADATWRLLAGHSMPQPVFDDIAEAAPPGVIVERARTDFVTLLKNCRLSISQGGYNTVMEVLATGARGIAVPYAGGHETEQTLRARLLAERGLIQQIPEGQLSVEELVAAVDRADGLPRPAPGSLANDGALASARLIAAWAKNGRIGS